MNDAVDDVEVDGVLRLSEGAMNARVMGGTRYSRTHGSVIEEEEPCGQLVETIDGVRLAGGEEEPGSEAPEENEGPVVAGHGRGRARCGEPQTLAVAGCSSTADGGGAAVLVARDKIRLPRDLRLSGSVR